MNNATPRDCIERLAAGDLQAFDELITEHAGSLRAFIALRAPATALIDEVAQETFVFAFRHIGDFRAGSSFGAWLRAIAFQILRREVQRFAREQANRARYGAEWLASLDDRPAPGPVGADVLPALRACLSKFNDVQRELLLLRYDKAWSSELIAQRLCRPPGWVRTNLCRLRQALRACLEAGAEARVPE